MQHQIETVAWPVKGCFEKFMLCQRFYCSLKTSLSSFEANVSLFESVDYYKENVRSLMVVSVIS